MPYLYPRRNLQFATQETHSRLDGWQAAGFLVVTAEIGRKVAL